MKLTKETKLTTMIYFSFAFFVLELISGYYTGSVALIADSFHMLSDVAALFIALYATKLAKRKDFGVEFSYGLQRAEVLGALINGIALLALCFTLMIEATQRIFQPSLIEHPQFVLYVGCAGLLVNIVGMFLFHEHHGHSHGDAQPIPSLEVVPGVFTVPVEIDIEYPNQLADRVIKVAQLMQHDAEEVRLEELSPKSTHFKENRFDLEEGGGHSHSHSHSTNRSHSTESRGHNLDDHHHAPHDHGHNEQEELGGHGGHDHLGHEHSHGGHDHHDLNMQGVFLHILGDLLASVGVIISAIIVIFVHQDWTKYFDPGISVFITLLIIKTSLPMVKSACYILLQRTPSSVSVESLRQDIMLIEGVLGVHELHVWQLSQAQMIASVHIVVPKPADGDTFEMESRYMELAKKVKAKLHAHGVHSTTVQPEFVDVDSEVSELNLCIVYLFIEMLFKSM